MRILWFSMTSGLYDVVNTGSWIEALQGVFKQFLPEIKVGMVFEYKKDDVFKVERDEVAYYPIHVKGSASPKENYQILRAHYLKAIDDFNPDIIHCFGTERWHYGLLAKEVKIPFVIHIMGFMNIYDLMDERVIHKMDYWKYFHYNPLKVFLTQKTERRIRKENQELEREVMALNHYFMGRTEWDKNIAKYYSPNSKYFYCPEAIRKGIYISDKRWTYHESKKLRLLTVGNAGSLKGNEIMLQAAWLLKNQFHIDFEWRYTSSVYTMSFFERLNDIKCQDVNIKLIGRLNAQQIAEELAGADFYIHPSIIDNSPNTVCEAQLIGTPVIATYVGGIPQLVDDGKTGWLYPYSEPHALTFKIMNLMHQRELLEKVSTSEYDMSHKRHDPKLLAERIMTIYKTIIDDYKGN